MPATGPGPGPLRGVRVIEVAAMGPAPFCGMLLADLGADVLRIDRPGGGARRRCSIRPATCCSAGAARWRSTSRGRGPRGAPVTVGAADVLIEGFRRCDGARAWARARLAHNPRLVYGRMTGWGQSGSLAHTAGHDLNYRAVGALHAIGRAGRTGAAAQPGGRFRRRRDAARGGRAGRRAACAPDR